MSRNRQVVRQWRLLRLVESSRMGKTGAELHRAVAEYGSVRTVYRDLEALQGAGFPLYQDDEGRWRLLTPSEGGPVIPIQPTEIIAMLLSEQIMESLRGSELGEPLIRLRSKLEATLAPRAREYVERLRGGLLATVPAPADYSGRRDEIERIERAIIETRRLRIVHFAPHRGESLERKVDPYGIWFVDGALYLIAFDHLRLDYRKFLVDRIREVELLSEPFEPDPSFDLQAYVGRGFRVWHGAVYRIVVEFEASLAHLPRERRFHRSQKLFPLPSGACRVVFEASGLPELAAWVASFGGRVRAVEPPELVEIILGLHQSGLRAHRPPGREPSGDPS